MSGASACRGGARRNADSARKPIQTRPGRLPTHAACPRAPNHPRRRLSPMALSRRGIADPTAAPSNAARHTAAIPSTGEGPPQGTRVREAQPAKARRHCEPAEADERREEAGVPRAGGQPWLGLAQRAADLRQRRHTTRRGCLLPADVTPGAIFAWVSLSSRGRSQAWCAGRTCNGFRARRRDVPSSASQTPGFPREERPRDGMR